MLEPRKPMLSIFRTIRSLHFPLNRIVIILGIIMALLSQRCISLLRIKCLINFGVHVHPIDDNFPLIGVLVILLSFYSTFAEIPVLNSRCIVLFADGHIQISLMRSIRIFAWTLRILGIKEFARSVLAHPRTMWLRVTFFGSISWLLARRHDIHELGTPVSHTSLCLWPLSHSVLHHRARLIEWRRNHFTIVRRDCRIIIKREVVLLS